MMCHKHLGWVAGLGFLAMVPATASLAQQANGIPVSPIEPIYELRAFGDGVLRLNRLTGETSYCRIVTDNLVCRLAVEERRAYEREIDAMNERVEQLEERGFADIPLPDREDLEQVAQIGEKALQRVRRSVSSLRAEIESRWR